MPSMDEYGEGFMDNSETNTNEPVNYSALYGFDIYGAMFRGIKSLIFKPKYSERKFGKSLKCKATNQQIEEFAGLLSSSNGNIIGTLLNTQLEGDEWTAGSSE
jgi:hypothetical protein